MSYLLVHQFDVCLFLVYAYPVLSMNSTNKVEYKKNFSSHTANSNFTISLHSTINSIRTKSELKLKINIILIEQLFNAV